MNSEVDEILLLDITDALERFPGEVALRVLKEQLWSFATLEDLYDFLRKRPETFQLNGSDPKKCSVVLRQLGQSPAGWEEYGAADVHLSVPRRRSSAPRPPTIPEELEASPAALRVGSCGEDSSPVPVPNRRVISAPARMMSTVPLGIEGITLQERPDSEPVPPVEEEQATPLPLPLLLRRSTSAPRPRPLQRSCSDSLAGVDCPAELVLKLKAAIRDSEESFLSVGELRKMAKWNVVRDGNLLEFLSKRPYHFVILRDIEGRTERDTVYLAGSEDGPDPTLAALSYYTHWQGEAKKPSRSRADHSRVKSAPAATGAAEGAKEEEEEREQDAEELSAGPPGTRVYVDGLPKVPSWKIQKLSGVVHSFLEAKLSRRSWQSQPEVEIHTDGATGGSTGRLTLTFADETCAADAVAHLEGQHIDPGHKLAVRRFDQYPRELLLLVGEMMGMLQPPSERSGLQVMECDQSRLPQKAASRLADDLQGLVGKWLWRNLAHSTVFEVHAREHGADLQVTINPAGGSPQNFLLRPGPDGAVQFYGRTLDKDRSSDGQKFWRRDDAPPIEWRRPDSQEEVIQRIKLILEEEGGVMRVEDLRHVITWLFYAEEHDKLRTFLRLHSSGNFVLHHKIHWVSLPEVEPEDSSDLPEELLALAGEWRSTLLRGKAEAEVTVVIPDSPGLIPHLEVHGLDSKSVISIRQLPDTSIKCGAWLLDKARQTSEVLHWTQESGMQAEWHRVTKWRRVTTVAAAAEPSPRAEAEGPLTAAATSAEHQEEPFTAAAAEPSSGAAGEEEPLSTAAAERPEEELLPSAAGHEEERLSPATAAAEAVPAAQKPKDTTASSKELTLDDLPGEWALDGHQQVVVESRLGRFVAILKKADGEERRELNLQDGTIYWGLFHLNRIWSKRDHLYWQALTPGPEIHEWKRTGEAPPADEAAAAAMPADVELVELLRDLLTKEGGEMECSRMMQRLQWSRLKPEHGDFLPFLFRHSDDFDVVGTSVPVVALRDMPARASRQPVATTPSPPAPGLAPVFSELEIIQSLEQVIEDAGGELDMAQVGHKVVWKAAVYGRLYDFLAMRPDHFSVVEVSPGRHMVSLAGAEPCHAAAIPALPSVSPKEAEKVLQEVLLQGPMYVNMLGSLANWRFRFKDALGTLSSFVAHRPELFAVKVHPFCQPQNLVSLAAPAATMQANDPAQVPEAVSEERATEILAEVLAEAAQLPIEKLSILTGWKRKYSHQHGGLQFFLRQRSDVFTVIRDYEAPQRNEVRLAASPGLADRAMSAVQQAIADAGGRVRLADLASQLQWSANNFNKLGGIYAFLRSRPEVFTIVQHDSPANDEVQLTTGQTLWRVCATPREAASSFDPPSRAAASACSPPSHAAAAAAAASDVAPAQAVEWLSRILISNHYACSFEELEARWVTRFQPDLGPLLEFVSSRPSTFTVHTSPLGDMEIHLAPVKASKNKIPKKD